MQKNVEGFNLWRMVQGQYRSAGAGPSGELDVTAISHAMDKLEMDDPTVMYRVILVGREVAKLRRTE